MDVDAGNAWIGLRVQLGESPGPPHQPFHSLPSPNVLKNKDTPSRQRRRARRAAVNQEKADVSAAEEAASIEKDQNNPPAELESVEIAIEQESVEETEMSDVVIEQNTVEEIELNEVVTEKVNQSHTVTKCSSDDIKVIEEEETKKTEEVIDKKNDTLNAPVEPVNGESDRNDVNMAIPPIVPIYAREVLNESLQVVMLSR